MSFGLTHARAPDRGQALRHAPSTHAVRHALPRLCAINACALAQRIKCNASLVLGSFSCRTFFPSYRADGTTGAWEPKKESWVRAQLNERDFTKTNCTLRITFARAPGFGAIALRLWEILPAEAVVARNASPDNAEASARPHEKKGRLSRPALKEVVKLRRKQRAPETEATGSCWFDAGTNPFARWESVTTLTARGRGTCFPSEHGRV